MDNTSDTENLDIESKKREIAHKLWEDEGCPEGKADDHWAQACLIVMDFESGPLESPNWLRKQPETETTFKILPEQPVEESLESTMQLLKKRIAGRSAA